METVSTHSRPKAAGFCLLCNRGDLGGFNTQPPEGGWCLAYTAMVAVLCFNTQPPEGGWPHYTGGYLLQMTFQHTAARRRLDQSEPSHIRSVSCFNTQPPEGGWDTLDTATAISYSFNTQPPEGGWLLELRFDHLESCFNTQPPEGGWSLCPHTIYQQM